MEFDFMCKKYVMYEDNDAVKMTVVLCSFSSIKSIKLKNNCFQGVCVSNSCTSDEVEQTTISIYFSFDQCLSDFPFRHQLSFTPLNGILKDFFFIVEQSPLVFELTLFANVNNAHTNPIHLTIAKLMGNRAV
mmetsp:Transcript_31015/g.45639  ORF Transcript_31015/g.45639 Transcript_31015/m.45639 type:complete len:132 (-) Transcript_31015:1963-2358(-)